MEIVHSSKIFLQFCQKKSVHRGTPLSSEFFKSPTVNMCGCDIETKYGQTVSKEFDRVIHCCSLASDRSCEKSAVTYVNIKYQAIPTSGYFAYKIVLKSLKLSSCVSISFFTLKNLKSQRLQRKLYSFQYFYKPKKR